VISIEMDASQLTKIQERLAQLPPRLIKRVYRELRPLVQQILFEKLDSHFAGWGPIGGKTDPIRLTNRTGRLFMSVLNSLKMSENGTDFQLSIGSDVPYAAIHEYGGEACDRPYLRARPYLQPTMNDLTEFLPYLLEAAIQKAQRSI
jgi:phage gpG-like protein